MAQRSRFYDSTAGDRVYDSSTFAQVMAAQIGDGVVYGSGAGLELAIVENSPPSMTVRVSNGIAFCQGYYHEVYSGPDVLTIAAANATNPRIDRVVLRRDLAARTGLIAVLTGTPAASPAAPALTQNVAGVYELPLAQVRVNAAVASVVNANITDERGTRAKGPDLGSVTDPTTGHRHGGAAGDGRKVQHSDLTNVGAGDHHPTAHLHDGADGSGTVAYAALTAKPTSFAPTAHAHDAAGTGGVVAYADLSGKPTQLSPTDHVIDPALGVHTGTLPWATVSGKPTTFAPSAHAHDAAGTGGTLAYADLTGKPTSMAPTAHAINGALHTGSLVWADISGKPATFTPAAHQANHGPSGSDPITQMARMRTAGGGAAGGDFWVGTTDPAASAAEGDVWIKG